LVYTPSQTEREPAARENAANSDKIEALTRSIKRLTLYATANEDWRDLLWRKLLTVATRQRIQQRAILLQQRHT